MINDLKRSLGAGSRPNKYLLELSWGNLDSERLNILCKAASLPESKITTITAGYHGRKLVLRGDTEFPETYDISIYDDANMSFRKFFIEWMRAIDNHLEYNTKLSDSVSGALGFIGNIIKNVNDTIDEIESNIDDIKDLPNRVTTTLKNWAYGYAGLPTSDYGNMKFAAPLKIWLLDHNGNKVHGVELENAFPVTLGSVDLAADKQNEIVEYNITFAFSEFNIIK